MYSLALLVSVLLILSPTTGAAGSECKIYVSSSDGINNTSCWTGGYQTPCATLDLALQGTATAAGNCSSFSIIYLYPGHYTLDTTNGLEEHNNVSIVGNGSKDVSIHVLSTESRSLSENDCPFELSVTVVNPSLSCSPQDCGLILTAYITNRCNPVSIEWKSDLNVDLNSFSFTVLSYQTCTMCSEGYCSYSGYYLDLSPSQYSQSILINGINSLELDIGDLSIASANINVTVACQEPYVVSDGYCRYATCTHGVPINRINKCVQCDNLLINLLIFIGIEILPITIMVLLIIILNIQLTNGSINGLVFYSQIIFFIYSDYILLVSTENDYQLFASPCNIFNLDFTPFLGNYSLCIVPNMSPLGAISFWYVIGFYPLLLLLLIYVWIILYDKGYRCVVLVTRPFHRCMARFWRMTGIEPSLIHSTASIYILCFTQIAGMSFKILRFGFNTDSNMSFFYDAKMEYFHGVHAAAGSVAILVLIVVIIIPTLYIQFYRFKWFHKLLGILHLRKQLLISLGDVFTGPYKNGSDNTFDYRFFAGFYLLARIIIMSSLIFPSGIYFVRLSLDLYRILLSIQGSFVFLLAIMVLIFRPFKRNIHNFFEVIMLIMEIAFFVSLFVVNVTNSYNYNCLTSLYDQSDDSMTRVKIIRYIVVSFNCLLFSILTLYIYYQLVKMMSNCHYYWEQHNHTVPANRDQEEDIQPLINDDDWVADRMENPQDYDEQHVTVSLVDSLPIDTEQPNTTIPSAATYGSINN